MLNKKEDRLPVKKIIELKSGSKHIVLLSAILNIIAATFFLLCPLNAICRTGHPSFIKWNDWVISVNEYGNLGSCYLAENEWENFVALEKPPQANLKEPAVYKVLYCISTSTEMTQVKPDGSIEIRRAQMTPAQIDFCRKSFELFKRMVFAYSGGKVKIESVERTLDFPFSGEYENMTVFNPSDYMDIGEGLNIDEFSSIIAHYYPGPVTVQYPSLTTNGSGWCKGLMQSSVVYDNSGEPGGEISLLARRTLREWCNQVSALLEKQGYRGLPNVVSLSKYTANPELYYLSYIISENLWGVIKDSKISGDEPAGNNLEIKIVNKGNEDIKRTKYFIWSQVKDNPFHKLPLINADNFERITGLEISEIIAGDNYIFIDIPKTQNILSNILANPDENDVSLNNELNFSREAFAHIRFFDAEKNQRDLLIIRADMVEPLIELLRIDHSAGRTHPSDSILGYMLYNGKFAIVMETILEVMPVNELSALVAADRHVQLKITTNKHWIIRGDKAEISFLLKNNSGDIIDIGTLSLTGFPDNKTVKVGNIYNLTGGEIHNFLIDMPTSNLKTDIFVLNAILDYEVGAEKFSIRKPVVFDIRDAVEATITPENTGLISKPEFNLVVNLRNNTGIRERGEVKLELPDKWKAHPSSYEFDMRGLNETREFKYAITMKDDIPDGDFAIGTFLKIKNRKTRGPAAVCHVRKSFGVNLLKYSFDKGIEGDFAITYGLYKVSLSREMPFAGAGCLKVEDEGGSHYGHVGMFSQGIFRPEMERGNSSYAFDTEDYPVIDFYLRYDSPDVNYGLRVVLDDNSAGYGIVLNGEWEKSFYEEMESESTVPVPVINKTLIPADGKWHRVVIDLDKALDEYLGNVPHRVVKIKFGDTCEMDFGWWKDNDRRTFHIDEFAIRKR